MCKAQAGYILYCFPKGFQRAMSRGFGSRIQQADHFIFSSSLESFSYHDMEPTLNLNI